MAVKGSKKKKKNNNLMLLGLLGLGAFMLLRKKPAAAAATSTTTTGTSGTNSSGAATGETWKNQFPLMQNNNPMAILRTNINWNGEAANNPNPTWEAFESMPYGFRATRINANSIINVLGGETDLPKFIHWWSRGGQGDMPTNYIKFVGDELGVDPRSVKLKPAAKIGEQEWQLLRAMTIFENSNAIRPYVDNLKTAAMASNNL